MQAIVTKYIGPTNTRGARIKAKCDTGSITIPHPHALSGAAVHEAAVAALLVKLGWTPENGHQGDWACGALPNQAGYAFVFVG